MWNRSDALHSISNPSLHPIYSLYFIDDNGARRTLWKRAKEREIRDFICLIITGETVQGKHVDIGRLPKPWTPKFWNLFFKTAQLKQKKPPFFLQNSCRFSQSDAMILFFQKTKNCLGFFVRKRVPKFRGKGVFREVPLAVAKRFQLNMPPSFAKSISAGSLSMV